MRKKLAAISIIMASSLILNVPVYAEKKDDTKAMSEDEFLNDLKTGLEKRWEMSDNEKDPESMSSDERVSSYTSMVNAEYDILKKYEDADFKNAKFDVMADAYVGALETQLKALGYYTSMTSVYDQYWNAGYNIRSILLPDFVDYYGLDVDASQLQDFRDTKAALEGAVTYTITSDTNVESETTSINTDGVNVDNPEQEPIEIYNDDGIKVTISKYELTQFGSARLTMDVVNLNHKDISLQSKNNSSIVINGISSQNVSLYGEVQIGKTGTVVLEMYPEQLDGISVNDIKTIDFNMAIYATTNNRMSFKAETGDIYLNVKDGIVTRRVVYTDAENIKKVQQLLTELGYNSGSTDGVPGKLTNSAILQFEKDHGLEENTDITPELIAELEKATQQ